MSDDNTYLGTVLPDFVKFQKIPRLSRECVITEKIDGTNGCILIMDDGRVQAGSRSRWITPEADNFGFARWVKDHEEELRTGLGVGLHYGEWWGLGIQRKYDQDRKRFSLFNTAKWSDDATRPACCDCVPVLYSGIFTTSAVEGAIAALRQVGSIAAPGFMKPEGVVIYHTAVRMYFKKTLDRDEEPKGMHP